MDGVFSLRRIKIPKQIEQPIMVQFWLLIAFAFLWPFFLIYGLLKFYDLLQFHKCSHCCKHFAYKKVRENIIKSYWYHSCLDGTPDLRHSYNHQVQEFTKIYSCKYCLREKSKMDTRKVNY